MTRSPRLDALIGRVPDPVRDGELLRSLLVPGDSAAYLLALRLRDGEHSRRRPLESSLPGLGAGGEGPGFAQPGERTLNALARAGVGAGWPRLAGESIESLAVLPGIGRLALEDILIAAVREWAHLQLGGVHARPGGETRPQRAPSPVQTGGPLEDQLALLCTWAREARGCEGALESIAAAQAEGARLPGPVAEALRGVDRFAATALHGHRATLASVFADLEGRPAFEVYRRRHLAPGARPGLREIGEELGVSGERARQREATITELIDAKMASPCSPLRAATERLRARLGPLAAAAELPGALASLDPQGRSLHGVPHRRALLLALAGGYRIAGEWLLDAEIEERTAEQLDAITAGGAPPWRREVLEALGAIGVAERHRLAWLESRPGVRLIDNRLVRWGQALTDQAEAVLTVVGRPLAVEAIFERVDSTSPRVLAERIAADPRFVLRSPGHYGLAAWPGRRYVAPPPPGPARPRHRTGRAGGGAPGGASRRIRTPAALVEAPTSPPELTARCFRLEAGWAFRVTVNAPLLRGGQGRMPRAFAALLGLGPGEDRRIASAYGEVRVHRSGLGARIGSLRGPAAGLRAVTGDLLFVIAASPARLDFALVNGRVLEALTGVARMALECGRQPGGEPLGQVARALGLDPEGDGLVAAIGERLGRRGEGALGDYLSAALDPPESA